MSGVGRKTANVVMSVGFGLPAFAVDTHVSRICKHHNIVKQTATPLEVEKRVTEVLPARRMAASPPSTHLFWTGSLPSKNPECQKYPQLYEFD